VKRRSNAAYRIVRAMGEGVHESETSEEDERRKKRRREAKEMISELC
jgi:hypothetical protein